MNALQKLLRTIHYRFRSSLDLPTHSQSELLYRLNRLPEPSTPHPEFPFPWGPVEYRSASVLRGQFTEIFADRHYAFLPSHPHPVIIDAGGNIGMSAIWFQQNYPLADITVYEADPDLIPIIIKNLAAAHLPNIHLHHAAVWTSNGSVSFNNAGLDQGAVTSSGAIQVPSIDLASHLPPHVDLLKLDIEGAEYPLIQHLCATGAIHKVQRLVAEFHLQRHEIDRFLLSLSQLRAAGMEVSLTAALGPWLGDAPLPSPFEIVAHHQGLVEVYAWRPHHL